MRRSSYAMTPPDAPEPRMRECPECGGECYRDDLYGNHETCPVCHGTGEVPDDHAAPDRDDLGDAAHHQRIDDEEEGR